MSTRSRSPSSAASRPRAAPMMRSHPLTSTPSSPSVPPSVSVAAPLPARLALLAVPRRRRGFMPPNSSHHRPTAECHLGESESSRTTPPIVVHLLTADRLLWRSALATFLPSPLSHLGACPRPTSSLHPVTQPSPKPSDRGTPSNPPGYDDNDDDEAIVTPSIPYDPMALRKAFEKAVVKRLMTYVPFGVLLSGGLDSSLVAAVAVRHLAGTEAARRLGTKLHSFYVGLEGSPDLKAAREVAEYLGTLHHEFHFTV
uniref:Asparagine synthetase domain-containing protein n=1 Tax=Zea mays TaxID=4577 RepID=A0A804QSJ5_MAIZE